MYYIFIWIYIFTIINEVHGALITLFDQLQSSKDEKIYSIKLKWKQSLCIVTKHEEKRTFELLAYPRIKILWLLLFSEKWQKLPSLFQLSIFQTSCSDFSSESVHNIAMSKIVYFFCTLASFNFEIDFGYLRMT